MKFLMVSFALAAVASAQYEAGSFKEPLDAAVYQDAIGAKYHPNVYKEQIAQSKHAGILRQTSEINPDGAYSYSYETENGISASENGVVKSDGPNGEGGTEAQGGYQYTAPDGQVITVKYVAGPNGFIAEGAHLPVAPPIPEAILRSIAYNAAHAQKEEIEYYKPEAQKPYYPQPTSSEKPYYPQYTTPKPVYYTPIKPTYQPYQTPFAQQAFSYTPQQFVTQAPVAVARR